MRRKTASRPESFMREQLIYDFGLAEIPNDKRTIPKKVKDAFIEEMPVRTLGVFFGKMYFCQNVSKYMDYLKRREFETELIKKLVDSFENSYSVDPQNQSYDFVIIKDGVFNILELNGNYHRYGTIKNLASTTFNDYCKYECAMRLKNVYGVPIDFITIDCIDGCDVENKKIIKKVLNHIINKN